MPSNNEMQIVLTLVDEASAKLKEVKGKLGETSDETKKIGTESEKVKRTFSDTYTDATKHVREFRRNLLLVTLTLSAIIASIREYAKYNNDARDATQEFEKQVTKLSVQVGKALLPALNAVNVAMSYWMNIAQGKAGFAKETEDETTALIEITNTLKNAAEDQKRLNDAFLAGKISVDEYYQATQNGAMANVELRQQEMSQIQEIAKLQRQFANEDFMESQRLNAEKIAFLQEYQTNYNTAHQGMYAFTTMLSQNIRTNLSGALTGIITGATRAKDAFKALGDQMIQAIVEFMVQKVVSFMLEKTLLAGQVASATAAGAATAAAWAPAALAANIASFGGAAAAAATTFPVAAASLAASMASSRVINVSGGAIGEGGAADNINAFPQAEGGDYLVSRPTLFLAGEAGPERATFTPLGGSSNNRLNGNVYIDISVDNPVLSREQDIDYLTEQISRKLASEVERIR